MPQSKQCDPHDSCAECSNAVQIVFRLLTKRASNPKLAIMLITVSSVMGRAVKPIACQDHPWRRGFFSTRFPAAGALNQAATQTDGIGLASNRPVLMNGQERAHYESAS